MLYCKRGDGGLGFPRLANLVPLVALRLGLRFQNSPDPVVRALSGCVCVTARLRKTARSVRINYPYTEQDLRHTKRSWARIELECWRGLVAQGQAVPSLTGDRVANSIMRDPSLLKPNRFITALKLRTNTAGNRTTLRRAGQQVDPLCRKCRLQPETLGHILGQCNFTKPAWVHRHNEICDFVMSKSELKEATVVCKEPQLTLAGVGNLKPDLVIANQEGVFVVDVTVRRENGESLLGARAEKIRKYSGLLPQLRAQFPEAKSGEVLPIVVGTLGAVPKSTLACLRKLGITDFGDHKTISMMALRASIEMYHGFMDHDFMVAPA